MPDLRETLQALARLEPDRFRDVRTFLAEVNLVGNWTLLAHTTAEGQAILAAALMELVNACQWGLTMDKSYLGWQISIYEGLGGEDDAPMPLGEAASKTDPFVLVLAEAVVQALEATNP